MVVKKSDEMNSIAVSRKELEDFAQQILGIRPTALRRMSTLILAQLLKMKLNGQSAAEEMAEEVRCLEVRNDHRSGPVLLGTDDGPKCLDAWVIYKRFNGSNYYLTLAGKEERNNYILQRLHDACKLDFPFLNDQHQPIHSSKTISQNVQDPFSTAA